MSNHQQTPPPPPPPAPQHIVCGLNAFNSTAKINNANWTSKLAVPVTMNEGDSLFVKNCYIDSRVQTSTTILIEEDTLIELEYYFYYLNRGGTNTPSQYQDFTAIAENGQSGISNLKLPFPTQQQQRVCEMATTASTALTVSAQNFTTTGIPFYVISNPVNPVTATNTTGNVDEKIGANLAYVTETIYYSPLWVTDMEANSNPKHTETSDPSGWFNYMTGIGTPPFATEADIMNNPLGFICPMPINACDGLPYLLYVTAINESDKPINDMWHPDYYKNLVPFTKKWKMVIPAGAYAPDFLAEFITRNMSKQKTKIQRNRSIANPVDDPVPPPPTPFPLTYNTLVTPISLINSQYDNTVNPLNIPSNQQGTITSYECPYLPDLRYGAFTNSLSGESNDTNPPTNTNTPWEFPGLNIFPGVSYTPSLYFSSKNPKSYPDNVTLFPGYISEVPNPFSWDFDNPNTTDDDDQPFVFRPHAFTNVLMSQASGGAQVRCDNFVVGKGPAPCNYYKQTTYSTDDTSVTGTNVALSNDILNVRLTLNDANVGLANNMPYVNLIGTGDYSNTDMNMEMMYRPFLSDVTSETFMSIAQCGRAMNDISHPLAPIYDYGIRPVCSTMNLASGNTLLAESINMCSPLVGAPLMSLIYNDENSGLFSMPYLHTPIYSKSDSTSTVVQESVGKYPTNYSFVNGLSARDTLGEVICDRQSGILLKSMTSKTKSGKDAGFWEKLGFNPKDICVQYDTAKPQAPFMTYQEFLRKTTGGFCGSANAYDPQYNQQGSSEVVYCATEDIQNFGGWYEGTGPNALDPFPAPGEINFLPNVAPVYYNVQNTNAIRGKSIPLDPNDVGHVLVELTAWSLPFIGESQLNEIKAIVSSYYVSPNSFITMPSPESFQYFHVGGPMTIDSIKVRLLNAKTMEELALVGPNSSIYIQFIKNFTGISVLQPPEAGTM